MSFSLDSVLGSFSADLSISGNLDPNFELFSFANLWFELLSNFLAFPHLTHAICEFSFCFITLGFSFFFLLYILLPLVNLGPIVLTDNIKDLVWC